MNGRMPAPVAATRTASRSAELAGQRTLAIQELSSLLEQMKQIEAQEANLLSVAGDRQAQVSCNVRSSGSSPNAVLHCGFAHISGTSAESPSSPGRPCSCFGS